MKKSLFFIILTALLTTVVTLNFSQAESDTPAVEFDNAADVLPSDLPYQPDVLMAAFTQINAHPLHNPQKNWIGGHVAVQLESQTITLTLYRKNHCLPGIFCRAYMPSPDRITLPIIHRNTNACGEATYIAKSDKRRDGGMLKQITIQDNRFSVCKMVYAAMTEIEYLTAFYDHTQERKVSALSTLLTQEINEEL